MEKRKEDHIKDLEKLMSDHKTNGTKPKFEDLIPEHQELIKEALANSPYKGFIPAKAPDDFSEPKNEGGVK